MLVGSPHRGKERLSREPICRARPVDSPENGSEGWDEGATGCKLEDRSPAKMDFFLTRGLQRTIFEQGEGCPDKAAVARSNRRVRCVAVIMRRDGVERRTNGKCWGFESCGPTLLGHHEVPHKGRPWPPAPPSLSRGRGLAPDYAEWRALEVTKGKSRLLVCRAHAAAYRSSL